VVFCYGAVIVVVDDVDGYNGFCVTTLVLVHRFF
jgi:hypothetical protein